jgi:acyl dehydratase
MAITMKLLVQSARFAHGVIGAGGEIAWPSATRPGDILHVISKVLDIKPSRSKPDRAIVLVESRTFNQNEELRQVLTSKLLVFKKRD